MGCGGSKDATKPGNSDPYRYTGTTIPVWKDDCKSLLKKALTQEVWDKLKDVKDSNGCTLGHIMNSGYVNQDSSIGVYAGGPETYTVFAPLLDQVNKNFTNY